MFVCQGPRALSEQMVENVSSHQTRELYEIGTHILVWGYRGIQIYVSHIEVEDTNLYVLSIIILICIVIA